MTGSADIKEASKHVTELSVAIHRLNDATGGLGRGFAEFSSTGNKAWTVISRFLSGTGLWALQNQFRGIGNALEVYFGQQTKSLEAAIKGAEANMALASSYQDIDDALNDIKGQDFYKMLKRTMTDADAERVATDFYEKLKKKMKKGMAKQEKKMAKLALPSMKERFDATVGSAPNIAGPDGRFDERMKFLGREITAPLKKLSFLNKLDPRDALFGSIEKIGGRIKKGGGRHEAGEEGRKGFRKQMKEHYKKLKNFKLVEAAGKLFGKLAEFATRAIAGLGAAMMWLLMIATGAVIIVAILKALWPHVKKTLEKHFQIFKNAFEGLLMILGGLWDLIKGIFRGKPEEVFKAFFGKILPGVVTLLGNLLLGITMVILGTVKSILKSIYEWFGNTSIGRWLGMGEDKQMSDLNALQQGKLSSAPKYAHGGLHSGGWAWVGERGKELVNLPAGARIHSNANSKAMMGNTININVSGSMGTSDAELRRLADKLGQEINKRVNRTVASPSGF